MNKIFTKLRKSGKSNYTQLLFCITFAVFLITSFGATLYSPTVQTVLPIGGDSRKQISMIFAIALIGCLVFSLYAGGLFFKYKGKEYGVFLSLGATKKILRKSLYLEIIKILVFCILTGIVAGSAASVGIWQLFRLFLVDTAQMKYQFSPLGIIVGFSFGLLVALAILFMAKIFMKRTNIMEILNEGRINEKIPETTKSYGLSGLILLVLGLILGYVVPSVTANYFGKLMPTFWSVMYLLAVLGVYRLLTYAVSHHERGRNPKKYYKNIIPFSMMKVNGKQTVQNMLVISLLIAGSLFALFYVPMTSQSLITNAEMPMDFSLHYKLSADEVNKDDIYILAKEYDVDITSYDEILFSQLLGSGVERDWTDDGDLIEDYQRKYIYFEFISQSELNRITDANIMVPNGHYYLITQPDTMEGFWTKYDDLDWVTNEETGKAIPLSFAGTIDIMELTNTKRNRYVLSDSDFETMSKNLSQTHQIKQIMFNVSDVDSSYFFATALYSEFLRRASVDMVYPEVYDEYQEQLAISNDKIYTYSNPMDLSATNPDLSQHWAYYPAFRILNQKLFFQNTAVFLLLFIYVAIICLATVGIIAYTRSITIGLNNKNLFGDLTKLGANNKYIKKCITIQLRKIFVIPTVIGSGLMLGLMTLILSGNDGLLSRIDIMTLAVDAGIVLVIFLYLYIVYQFSLKKIKKIVGI